MRFSASLIVVVGASLADAFAPQPRANVARAAPIYASKQNSDNNVVDTIESIDATVKGALSGMALAAAMWAAPATMAGPVASSFPSVASGNNVIASSVASAKEMARGTGTRVNKDPESLLRYGLPINNKEVGADTTDSI